MNGHSRSSIRDTISRGELIKICGIREPEHAIAAAEAGADLLGFIFAPSRRQVSPKQARACIDAARAVPRSTPLLAVGVFVDAEAAELEHVAAVAGLDVVQLSGNEPVSYVRDLSLAAIKAFQPPPGERADALLESMNEYLASGGAVAALVDGHDPVAAGGTGNRTDWNLAAQVSARQPLLLAGGLDADNVAEAIGAVCPLGVDVSGGVEREGVKDSVLIADFIRQARTAFALTP